MKSNNLLRKLTLGTVTVVAVTALFSSVAYAADDTASQDAAALQGLFEDSGFTVTEGTFYEIDTVKEASAGNLMSCFGNKCRISLYGFLICQMVRLRKLQIPSSHQEDGSINCARMRRLYY